MKGERYDSIDVIEQTMTNIPKSICKNDLVQAFDDLYNRLERCIALKWGLFKNLNVNNFFSTFFCFYNFSHGIFSTYCVLTGINDF